MIAQWFRRRESTATAVTALLFLCLLWSLGSLRSDLFPNLVPDLLPRLQRQVVPFALLAVTAALFAVVRGAQWPRGRQIRDAILIGLGLFVLPAAMIAFSREWVSDLTRVALFSLVPVFAVVFEPHIGRRSGMPATNGLLAALAAVVGTLCVFPIDPPRSITAAGAFCAVLIAAACVAAANCRAVAAAAELPGRSIAPMAAIAGATAAAGLGLASALAEQTVWKWHLLAPQLAWSAAAELPGLLLLFWLMPRMSAARMTTRFLLAPLLAILIAMELLQPTVGLRTWFGLLLVAAGAGWLLLARDDEPETGSLPLKLNR